MNPNTKRLANNGYSLLISIKIFIAKKIKIKKKQQMRELGSSGPYAMLFGKKKHGD